jgi:hypothetical protein
MAGLFARQVQLVSEQVGELRRQALIQLANQSFAAADRQNTEILGRSPDFQTIVDGQAGASPDRVKLGGTIVYLFKLGSATLQEAVDDAFRMLAELSPVQTGRFQNSFRLFVNGVEQNLVAGGEALELRDDDEIQITNLQPYARKIERGWSSQAPNGIFEVVAAGLKSRYASTLRINFAYDRYPGFEVGAGRRGAALNSHSREGRADFDRAGRYPTIYLRSK